MVKARVELTGPLTWNGSGHRFKRGESKIITNPADVLMFQSKGGFLVNILEGSPKPAQPAPQPAPEALSEAEDQAPEEPLTGDFARSDLEQQTKASLVQLVNDAGMDVELDMSMKKNDMIDAILNVS